jgi:hypothetical protein
VGEEEVVTSGETGEETIVEGGDQVTNRSRIKLAVVTTTNYKRTSTVSTQLHANGAIKGLLQLDYIFYRIQPEAFTEASAQGIGILIELRFQLGEIATRV